MCPFEYNMLACGKPVSRQPRSALHAKSQAVEWEASRTDISGRPMELGLRRACECVCAVAGWGQHGRGRYSGEQKQKLVDAPTLGPFNRN
jgi:hypothetical protein